MPAPVIPIRPDVVVAVGRFVNLHTPCEVCGELFAVGADTWHCDRCEGVMHAPCFWGRVASMDECLEYARRSIRDDLPDDYCPAVVCLRCRAREGG